jgi:DNA-cytosine methyltransferase
VLRAVYLMGKDMAELLESTWSDEVANDRKHRPQVYDKPSTTVRKEWCRRPQEAHLADADKYRRLSVQEIAIIQGFDPSWVEVDGLTENEKIALIGNAVAPPVAKAFGFVLSEAQLLTKQTYLEICAGIGGLSLGFPYLTPIAKVEMWDVACRVLRARFPPEVIREMKAQEYAFEAQAGNVGLLCGGPPCQPWSQAGNKRGNDDPRDVMGFTPQAVAACEPDVFVFENVPGLLSSKEHEEYRQALWKRLRNPKPGLHYGLDYKIFNAADFGVPQVRRRVFIVGIKGASDARARNFLAGVAAATTHHDPSKPAYKKKPWITLREALKGVVNENPWRKWNIAASEDQETIVDDDSPAPVQAAPRSPAINDASWREKISFWWPKKDHQLRFGDSRWDFIAADAARRGRSILIDGALDGRGGRKHFVVSGDYLPSIEALAPILKASTKFVYWDMPRIDADSDFAKLCPAGYVRSTWLSLLRDVSRGCHRLLGQGGYFAVQTDEETAHYARMVLDETYGPANHVTTFAWEKKYSPQNDRQTPTDSFDYVIVYSTVPSATITQKIGRLVKQDDLTDDGDYRGPYSAGHKGAMSGSEKTKFKVNAPPYRWELLSGSKLPECTNSCFDPVTGVFYFEKITGVGRFHLSVRCVDAKGDSSVAKIAFEIRPRKDRDDKWIEPDDVWWLFKTDPNGIQAGGQLRVETTCAEPGVEGSPYSLVLKAYGGEPYVGKSDQPKSGRYWEFGRSTLVKHVLRAAASFGKKGCSLPSEKKFVSRDETMKRVSVRNWLPWWQVGKAEDATRHLNKLAAKGYGESLSNSFAKPEGLAVFLAELFAPQDGDLVLSLGDEYGTMAAACIKTGRQVVHLVGPAEYSQRRWDATGAVRLRAVVAGEDEWGLNEAATEDEVFVQAEPGTVLNGRLSSSSITRTQLNDVRIDMRNDEAYSPFVAALRGFLPSATSPTGYEDLSGGWCAVLEPEETLDEIRLAELEGIARRGKPVVVMYERSDLQGDAAVAPGLKLIRVPFEAD